MDVTVGGAISIIQGTAPLATMTKGRGKHSMVNTDRLDTWLASRTLQASRSFEDAIRLTVDFEFAMFRCSSIAGQHAS